MTKTAVIRARVTPELKASTEKILTQLGISFSEAISMFCNQICLKKGLPFDVRLPNKETLKALQDAVKKVNLRKYKSLDELKNSS